MTVILGMGSNLGDRLANLRKALQLIRQINHLVVEQVSPLYLSDALLPENAPADWDRPHVNLALHCETSLKPHELLNQLKTIEGMLGRKPEKRHWGARIIDIDILAWDELIIEDEKLTVPHSSLLDRPFALWPLADVAPFWVYPREGSEQGKIAAEIAKKWGSRFSGEAPLHARQIYQRIDTPQLVGIVNMTPDSFSDGGEFLNADRALAQLFSLVETGADVIDIGAESTAPHATVLTAEKEWQRLQPLLEILREKREKFLLPPKISIDTYHPETATKALAWGVDWINDVTGLTNPEMCAVLAQSQVDCVMMHSLSIPASREHVLPLNQDCVKTVYDWGAKQLDEIEKIGITRQRIIFDPGIGFGKTPEQSLALIHAAKIFKNLGTRVLIGHSRKSFLSLVTPFAASDRDSETLAISLYLINQGIDFLRVHHVEKNARGIRAFMAC